MAFATVILHEEISPKGIIQLTQEGICPRYIQCNITYNRINVQ